MKFPVIPDTELSTSAADIFVVYKRSPNDCQSSSRLDSPKGEFSDFRSKDDIFVWQEEGLYESGGDEVSGELLNVNSLDPKKAKRPD